MMKGYFFGLPLDEAIKVILIYKEKGFVPSKDYVDGFQDGYKTAHTDFERDMKKALHSTIMLDDAIDWCEE